MRERPSLKRIVILMVLVASLISINGVFALYEQTVQNGVIIECRYKATPLAFLGWPPGAVGWKRVKIPECKPTYAGTCAQSRFYFADGTYEVDVCAHATVSV